MRLSRLLTAFLLLSALVSTSCSKSSVQPPSSSTGALTANTTLNNLATRPIERHILTLNGMNSMTEFIRADVRSRMDEEPTGDSDAGYDPSTVDTSTATEQPQADGGEIPAEEAQQNTSEDAVSAGSSDDAKFVWARKSFGDAVKKDPTNNGVIVLYADETYFDLEALTAFIEDGRNRIARKSGIEGDRIQVVFGGYRGVPQVEFWVIPDGGSMPEFRPEERTKPNGLED